MGNMMKINSAGRELRQVSIIRLEQFNRLRIIDIPHAIWNFTVFKMSGSELIERHPDRIGMILASKIASDIIKRYYALLNNIPKNTKFLRNFTHKSSFRGITFLGDESRGDFLLLKERASLSEANIDLSSNHTENIAHNFHLSRVWLDKKSTFSILRN